MKTYHQRAAELRHMDALACRALSAKLWTQDYLDGWVEMGLVHVEHFYRDPRWRSYVLPCTRTALEVKCLPLFGAAA